MNKETGGNAFPQIFKKTEKDGRVVTVTRLGMTLRDYFAAQAMVAFIDKDQWQSSIGDIADSVAFNAYAMADAMLKEKFND